MLWILQEYSSVATKAFAAADFTAFAATFAVAFAAAFVAVFAAFAATAATAQQQQHEEVHNCISHGSCSMWTWELFEFRSPWLLVLCSWLLLELLKQFCVQGMPKGPFL